MKRNSAYALIYLMVAIAARVSTETTANVGYLLLAGYALVGRRHAIEALALSWFFTMLNPGIGAEADGSSIGRYAVLIASAVSVFLRSFPEALRVSRPSAFTIGIGGFLVSHAVLFSPYVDVSVLKAASWLIAMVTIFEGWARIPGYERMRLARRLYGGLVALMLISLPMLGLSVGYLRNGTGFQGILNHPQVFGPTMALLGAWSLGRMLGERRPAWSLVLLVGTSLVLILLSEARTAGLALLLGVLTAIVTSPLLSGRPVKSVLKGLQSKRIALLLMLMLIAGLFAANPLERVITSYISKSGRAEVASVIEAYDTSRGGLIAEMWTNIIDKPLQGIGFGIASDPRDMDVTRDQLLGLPTGAAIEKGVLPLAVLEEVGLIGLILISLWVLMIVRRSAGAGFFQLLVIYTILFLNLGEANLFSPGGFGMLELIVVGWAIFSPSSTAGPLSSIDLRSFEEKRECSGSAAKWC